MDASIGETSRVYHSKVDSSGRIVLPADVRLRQHIQAGDRIVIVDNRDGLQVKTQDQAIREAQAVLAKLAPPGVSLVDELLAERRAEAARE